jgi:tetratricopeptide (TPR) repeat protein
MTAKKAASPVDRRSQQALEAFERAVKALGKHDWEKARDQIEALIASYPEERELVERARAYKVVCDRALEKKPAYRPKTFEELLHHGVYLHNRGEYEEALKVLRLAVEMHPKNDHAQYCLAATAARAGDHPSALKALRSAVLAGPANRAQARQDPDFEALRGDEEFLSIVHSRAS